MTHNITIGNTTLSLNDNKHYDNHYNETRHNDTNAVSFCIVMLTVFILSVVMLNVVMYSVVVLNVVASKYQGMPGMRVDRIFDAATDDSSRFCKKL